jgi:Ca2+-binding EF-hand superfamily protein
MMSIAVVIAAVFGTAAQGHEKSGAPGPSALSAKPSAEVLARFDTNRDGTLDAAERAAMRRDILERMQPLRDATVKQYDWNKNGRLDDEEALAWQQDREQRHAFVEKWALERYDADKNGVLDASEQQVRKAAREEWVRQKKEQILATYDANRNGTLDPEEKAAIRQQSDAARQKALEMYDSNRDGRLDDAERSAATGAAGASGATGSTDIRHTGRQQTAAGAAAAGTGETSAAKAPAGPPLAGLRISPAGVGYEQGANIAFTLGSAAPVTVRIHDAAGRLVRTLATGARKDAGAQVLHWDGTRGGGRAVANGLYLVTVEVPGGKATQKVAFIR